MCNNILEYPLRGAAAPERAGAVPLPAGRVSYKQRTHGDVDIKRQLLVGDGQICACGSGPSPRTGVTCGMAGSPVFHVMLRQRG